MTYSVMWQRVQSIDAVFIRSAIALVAAVALGMSSLVKFPLPFTPVPITLQTFVLFVGAAMLRRHFSVQMVLWYVLLGGMGAPFFAGGVGWSALSGATGGYILGFVISAGFIGYGQQRVSGLTSQLVLFFMASAILFTSGVVWLALVMRLDFVQAVTAGVLPFIPGNVVKVIAAASVMHGVRSFKQRDER